MRLSRALAVLSLGLASLVLAPCKEDEPGERPGIEELAAALGRQRPVEPRLTGFDVHASCSHSKDSTRLIPLAICSPRPKPGTPEFKEIRKVVSRLERTARRGPAEDAAHEDAAVALLVWPGGAKSTDAVVEALETAAKRKPKNARLLSDLAAAYYVRAQEKDEPQDLVRALNAAARAKNADPDLLEARFNLALILDRLYLRRTAEAAWEEYRKLDDVSGWAEEARIRRASLGGRSIPEQWNSELPNLRASALRGDIGTVRRIVGIDPQAAREYAMEDLLGGWGERFLDGDQEGAARELRIAREVGQAFLSVNGEPTIRLATEAIEKTGGNLAAKRALAGGHQAFRAGMRSFRGLKNREAGRHFKRAQELFVTRATPMQFWSLAGEARCLAYDSNFDEAETIFQYVLDKAQRERLSALEAWCHWGLGWIRERQGRLGDSFGPMIAAERQYARLRESENRGAIWSYIADRLFALGQSGAAWRDRYRALGQLSRFPVSWRWHIVLLDGARAAIAEGLPEAGLLLQDEGLSAAQVIGDSTRLAEAHWSRSKIFLALDRLRKAREDALLASRYAQAAGAEAPREKLLADVALARGQVFQRTEKETALAALSGAVELYKAMGVVPGLAYASLSRARLYRELGRDLEAESDLATALRLLEDPSSRALDPDLRVSFSESLQDIYDEWIDFQWERRRDAESALSGIERARAFPRGWNADRSSSPLWQASNLPNQLPEGVVILEYALLRERLLIWCISSEGVWTFEQRIGESEVTRKVDEFLQSIQSGEDARGIARLATALHDLLIPEQISELEGEETIYFIPDKALNKVPFAALLNRATGRFLVEDHPVAISPSLMDLVNHSWTSEMETPGSALLVGNPATGRSRLMGLPDLPGALSELNAVRALFPRARALTGAEATKETLLKELDQHPMFAFAGHAVSNLASPSRSYLVLAPSTGDETSGLLFGADLLGRRLKRLRLVVLSACSSVGPRSARVSGLAGMARFFLDAGAETVVGSLWEVEDRETVPFLLSFYRGVAKGEPVIEALRRAQVEILEKDERSPLQIKTWSALEVVIGGVAP